MGIERTDEDIALAIPAFLSREFPLARNRLVEVEHVTQDEGRVLLQLGAEWDAKRDEDVIDDIQSAVIEQYDAITDVYVSISDSEDREVDRTPVDGTDAADFI